VTRSRDFEPQPGGTSRLSHPHRETLLAPVKSLEEALQEAFEKADSLEAPLIERLKFYLRESRKLLPELESAYDQLVQRIAATEADKHVPAVGEMVPDFIMIDSVGNLVDLAGLITKGRLVVSFNRGPWCDYCGLELHALSRAYPEIVAAGGDAISIVPETARFARNLQKVREVPFRVLIDLDFAYALSLGLVFWLGEKLKEMYRGFGVDLERLQGHGGWFLPIPATLVVGRDGRVKARFVDPDFRHRMNIEDILRVIPENG
jgi:peroxiredoxin